MYNEDIPRATIKAHLEALRKDTTKVAQRMLVVFLTRVATKIVYVVR